MELRGLKTEDLICELERREGVRSTKAESYEVCKIQVSGDEDKQLRYLKGYGPLMILEVKL